MTNKSWGPVREEGFLSSGFGRMKNRRNDSFRRTIFYFLRLKSNVVGLFISFLTGGLDFGNF